MRRVVIEVMCDECGTLQLFEIYSNAGQRLAMTYDVTDTMEKHGWATQQVEGGSRFVQRDLCERCKPTRSKARAAIAKAEGE